MALQPKNRFSSLCFRALQAGLLAGLGVSLASCGSRPVAWHSAGERSQLDTGSAAVFEGGEVLAARGEAEEPEYVWRDASLNIRTIDSQWKDAMWPERSYHRGYYRRFTLPRNADTVFYYEQGSWSSSSTQYRSSGSWGGYGGHSRGW